MLGRHRMLILPLTVVGMATSCDADPLSPSDFSGEYALAQVNGQNLGRYHHLGGVDCDAAFTSGSLIITSNRQFRVRLDFDFRCFGVDPYDGSDFLVVVGTDIKSTSDELVLNGIGPDLIGGTGSDRWSFDVLPNGSHVELRMWGFNGEYWGDPVFTMGPKQLYDGPCFIGC